jgi:hypothetical protein
LILMVSITCLMGVSYHFNTFKLLRIFHSPRTFSLTFFPLILAFYDPDGYYFNKDGFDEFGGYYDAKGIYHPGEKNKHEFEELYQDYDEEDDLIKQFEQGDDDEFAEENYAKYEREYKQLKNMYAEEEETFDDEGAK